MAFEFGDLVIQDGPAIRGGNACYCDSGAQGSYVCIDHRRSDLYPLLWIKYARSGSRPDLDGIAYHPVRGMIRVRGERCTLLSSISDVRVV